MAKTRIKTTPTRMQKEALTASTAVNPTNNNRIITEHVLKKRICALNNSMLNKEAIPLQSTIIVQPPKRTNSISSVTSTISHTSDGHCSSIESPPPTSSSGSGNGNCSSSTATTPTNSNGPTMDELTENAIKTLNAGLLAKTNALALKNRKVYMITEKCDDSSSSLGGSSHTGVGGGGNGGTGCAGKTGGGQKRKMYLIMEEKDTPDKCVDGQMEKFMKSESNNGNKKLTLFTDTTNGQLPQKIEKILPEILSCIQAKGAAALGGNCINSLASMTSAGSHAVTGATNARLISQDPNGKVSATTTTTTTTTTSSSSASANGNETPKIRLKTDKDNNERLPLTLPPKKNRTKIITTQIIPVNNHYHPPTVSPQLVPPNSNAGDVMTTSSSSSELRNNAVVTAAAAQITQTTNGSNSSSSSYVRADKSSATPVIVNATTLLMANGTNGFSSSSKENGNKFSTSSSSAASPSPQLHKNINLSTDFLFLMKMLPKLESIAEPQKSYVKACIEDLINQYAPPTFGDH